MTFLVCVPGVAVLGGGLIALGQPLPAGGNLPTGVDQIELHPAFRIERVAVEPVVRDPVDLQFDEHGHAYVIEMGGYPFASEVEAEFPGKLVRLEDTDGDGVYDRRHVFADRFQYADAILPYRGGLLVAAPPDLLFVQDTDGDGRADLRQVLLSGFAVGNSQHNFNGLIYGLDNWVYAGNGGNSGTLFWPDRPAEKHPMLHRDVKFDLPGQRLEFFGRTTTGFNVALDDWGRIFTTHNLHHVNHLVFPLRYLDPHPQLRPRGNPDISDHKTGGLDRAYPIGKQEARLNHPEQSGFFSCSCGITFYGGGAFPEEFNGNLFVADSVMNLIHRDVLRPDGPSFLAARGRPKVEFLASADRHSRPVNMRVGPDGALYIVDFYRAVIEHPEWIPDELERHLDLHAGTNQGRIYRVTPQAGLPRVTPRFPREDLAFVVAQLEHRNRWWRDTAQRLLVWWNDPRCVPLLERLARDSTFPQARLHALWTLHGLAPAAPPPDAQGALTEPLILRALRDPHPGVRENALVLAEPGLAAAPARFAAVLGLTDDPDARVRMQVALTLGTVAWAEEPARRESVLRSLLTLLERDGTNEWSRFALLTTTARAPWLSLQAVLGTRDLMRTAAGEPTPARVAFLAELSELLGARRLGVELTEALEALVGDRTASAEELLTVLQGLNSGLSRERVLELPDPARSRLEAALTALRRSAPIARLAALWELRQHLGLRADAEQAAVLGGAAEVVINRDAALPERLANLDLLRFGPFPDRRELLFGLLDFREPRELQQAALRQLVQERDPAVAAYLIGAWSRLSREARTEASDYFINRSWSHDALLTALEAGRLQMGQLNLDLERRRRLLRSSDAGIRARAEALFSDAGVVTRAEVLVQLQPAVRLTGDPDRGKVHFENLCATCHTMGTLGFAVGPDLTEIARKGAETLLSDIFDPNAAVNTEYLNYTIEDDEDEVYSGIVISETEALVVLRAAGGLDLSIARSRIRSFTSSGLSLMPENLEAGLSHQDVADLLAYLQQPK